MSNANSPGLREEKELFGNGCKYIAGIDEAGRGALAGPVISAIVVFEKKNLEKWLKFDIRDSKKLSHRQRIPLLEIIYQNAIEVKFSRVNEGIIDQINIRQATLLSMKRGIKRLKNQPDFLLIDGKDRLENLSINQKTIIHGDRKSVV